jgi:hypothetical protein
LSWLFLVLFRVKQLASQLVLVYVCMAYSVKSRRFLV